MKIKRMEKKRDNYFMRFHKEVDLPYLERLVSVRNQGGGNLKKEWGK